MQWLTADIVFDGFDFYTSFFIQVDETGMIRQTTRELPQHDVKKLKGLLLPGMINAHCHLELSHTQGLIEQKTGLSSFLQEISKIIPQKIADEKIQQAIKKALKDMSQSGTVAVGDICNTAKTITVKKESEIYFHNFIECIAIKETDVSRRFDEYQLVFNLFKKEFESSLALHTPYTCHEKLYRLVNEHSNFITIHNQECEAENLLFARQAGKFDDFYKHFGLDKKEIIQEHTRKSSFENSQRIFKRSTKKLFVHNTYTQESDLQYADENSWFCFCPKANLYIENSLPNMPIFTEFQDKIVLGTDSLASNDALNILSEVKTIQDNFPEIPLKNILQWATINGAHLFGLEKEFGSFEVGKKPKFVHVEAFDIQDNCLISPELKVYQT